MTSCCCGNFFVWFRELVRFFLFLSVAFLCIFKSTDKPGNENEVRNECCKSFNTFQTFSTLSEFF